VEGIGETDVFVREESIVSESWPPAPMAIRHLEWVDGDERHGVLVRLWRPVRWDGESICDLAIDGLPEPLRMGVRGGDSLQAVELAFDAIRVFLEPYRGHIAYCGVVGWYGVSARVPSFDIEESRYLEDLIEREVAHFNDILGGRRERRRFEEAARRLDLPPLDNLEAATFDALVELVYDAARRERACKNADDGDGAKVFAERRRRIAAALTKRPDRTRALEQFLASDEPELLRSALLLADPAAARAPLERLRGLDPDAAKMIDGVYDRRRREAARPKPWDTPAG
jgi:hypothetical protein